MGRGGSRARLVSKEVIPEGRPDVATRPAGERIFPQYGMEEEGIRGPLEPREQNRPSIGTRRQLWVSSLNTNDRVNTAPSPLPRWSRSDRNSERVTSGEKRERVATAVLFRSGEDERVKRATLVNLALRLLPIYRSTQI
jgi:hypothetical protein